MIDHPDLATDYQTLKAITRGGAQAADDKAMDAYWLAMESGESKEEAGKRFSETYQKFVNGMDKRD
jgi:hypothetical protein